MNKKVMTAIIVCVVAIGTLGFASLRTPATELVKRDTLREMRDENREAHKEILDLIRSFHKEAN